MIINKCYQIESINLMNSIPSINGERMSIYIYITITLPNLFYFFTIIGIRVFPTE
jgi:hypothetical protein